MLSQSVRSALQTERKRLQAQVSAIDALLVDDDGQTHTLKAPSPNESSNGAGEGLRAMFRRILAENPRGMTVGELVTAVEAAGFRPSGTTRTVNLLHGDLSRLVKAGKIHKSGKRYSMPPGGHQ